jgi:hypothetical protein
MSDKVILLNDGNNIIYPKVSDDNLSHYNNTLKAILDTLEDNKNNIKNINFIKSYNKLYNIIIDLENLVLDSNKEEAVLNIENNVLLIENIINEIKSIILNDNKNANINTLDDIKKYISIFRKDTILSVLNNNFNTDEFIVPDGTPGIGSETFYNTTLKRITLPESITYIGNRAFGSTNIEDIIFKGTSNIQSIGDYAFFSTYYKDTTKMHFSNDGEIILDNINSIGKYAFEYCKYLKNITIGGNIEKIDEECFCSSGLQNVNITNNNLKSIERSAFYNCTELESINLPDSIISISRYAFRNCTELRYINLSNNIIHIDEYAFNNCRNLSSINIPSNNNFTSIDNSVFAGCSGLTSVNIPSNVTAIGDSAFASCTNLSTINISNNIAIIDSNAFSNCTNLENIIIQDTINNNYDNKGYIGRYAFRNCNLLKSITIPKSIYGIKSNAFSSSIEEINFQDNSNLKEISNEAFADTNIESIYLPDGIETLGDIIFFNCANLKEVSIPGTVKEIKYQLFTHDDAFHPNVNNIILNEGTEKIARNVFYKCNNLKKMYFPSTINNLEPEFDEHTLFTEYIVSEENQTYCSIDGIIYSKNMEILVRYPPRKSIDNFIIPDGVKEIKENACNNSCNITNSIIIPDSVIKIGEYAFPYIWYVKNIRLSNNITKIENSTFNNCQALETINLPNSITSIGKEAFAGCILLNSLTQLPDSITYIGFEAFAGCRSLTTLILPKNLTTIGYAAFSGCTSLTTLYIKNNIQNLDTSSSFTSSQGYYNNLFYNCTNLEFVIIENGFNFHYLNLSYSTKYSVETMVSWLNALYDRTGLSSYTFTIGEENLAKLSDEEKAIATNKNWTLA